MNHPWYANTTGTATTCDAWTLNNYTTNTTATTNVQTITVSNNTTSDDLVVYLGNAIAAWETYERKHNVPPPKRPRLRPPAAFNRYLNASDLVEEFIRFAGTEGVRQNDVLGLPIELFIKWLVIRACEEDHEEPGVTLELPARAQPRCLGCQRWMCRGTVVPLHGDVCAGRYFSRVAA